MQLCLFAIRRGIVAAAVAIGASLSATPASAAKILFYSSVPSSRSPAIT
jgi:hypothetical protein